MKKLLLALALISAAQVTMPLLGLRDRSYDDRYYRGDRPGIVGGALNIAADAVDTTADVVDRPYYRDGRYDRGYGYGRRGYGYDRDGYYGRRHFWNR